MDTHRINEMEQRLVRATAAVDAIGTPFCITVDNDTIDERDAEGRANDNYGTVTVRHRDTMQQERISIDQLLGYLKSNL